MLSRITENVVLLFPLLDFTLSAMVLPRPPSSPNHIQHDYNKVTVSKSYQEKALPVFERNPAVGKSDLVDVKLLEVQVEDFSKENTPTWESVEIIDHNDTYPSPEVVAHSIFGVRNVEGFSPRFQLEKIPGVRNFPEKLYYLKPNVDVNVRGHSGNFRKDPSGRQTTTGTSRRAAIMRPLRGNEKPRKIPKKYYADDEFSTSENPFVITSSELPKQIPAPPSKIPVRFPAAHTTTPIFGTVLQRTEIFPEVEA